MRPWVTKEQLSEAVRRAPLPDRFIADRVFAAGQQAARQREDAIWAQLGLPAWQPPAQRRRARLRRLWRARPYLRWERTYPTDRYLGVAWGPQVTTDTWGVGLGLGRWAVVLHVPRYALWQLRQGRLDRDARLGYLAERLVTPERYASPETLARSSSTPGRTSGTPGAGAPAWCWRTAATSGWAPRASRAGLAVTPGRHGWRR